MEKKPPIATTQYPILDSAEIYDKPLPQKQQSHFHPRHQPQNVPPTMGWCGMNQKNKPQSNSIGATSLIFLAGGMNIAWSFNMTINTNLFLNTYMQVSWFIGVIIGVFLGALVMNRFPTKPIQLFAAFLVLLDGILFTALPYDSDALLAARYLDGIANGLVIIPALILSGEEVIQHLRGLVSTTIEAMSFSLGILIEVLYSTLYEPYEVYNFPVNRFHGVLIMIYAVTALLMGFYLIVESPVYFLLHNEEELAIESLRRLQRPFVVTFETYELLEEHKRYIAENNEMTWGESAAAGISPLIKMTIYRGLNALSFSALLVVAFRVVMRAGTNGYAAWAFITLCFMRWLSIFISSFLVDSAGRKNLVLCGFLVAGAMLVAVGSIFSFKINLTLQDRMITCMILLFIVQFFAGLFIAPSSTYLTEAFPLAVKPYYIAFTIIIEMLIQIIVGSCSFHSNSYSRYFITVGCLYLAYFILGIFCIPETKKLTLREAQEKFRKIITFRN